jgi:hypothetical protein
VKLRDIGRDPPRLVALEQNFAFASLFRLFIRG